VGAPISDADAFEVVDEAVDRVEEDVGFEIRFGLDMAAAELYDDDQEAYVYGGRRSRPTSRSTTSPTSSTSTTSRTSRTRSTRTTTRRSRS